RKFCYGFPFETADNCIAENRITRPGKGTVAIEECIVFQSGSSFPPGLETRGFNGRAVKEQYIEVLVLPGRDHGDGVAGDGFLHIPEDGGTIGTGSNLVYHLIVAADKTDGDPLNRTGGGNGSGSHKNFINT